MRYPGAVKMEKKIGIPLGVQTRKNYSYLNYPGTGEVIAEGQPRTPHWELHSEWNILF